MRPARDHQEFLDDPRGLYVAGHSFVLWTLDETLGGSIYFGRPDVRDFPALLRFARMPFHPKLRVPWDAVVDCGAMKDLDPKAFEILLGYIGGLGDLGERVRRVSLVRPPGQVGAMVAGLFYELVRPTFRAGLFADREEAFRWLGRSDGERAAVEEVLAGVHETPSVPRQLRDWLARHLDQATIGIAARALGLSPRSLQRRLLESGSSFRAEVERARVRAAEGLLTGDNASLETIARAVGCSTLWRFSSMFRRVTGERPEDFRARRKPG